MDYLKLKDVVDEPEKHECCSVSGAWLPFERWGTWEYSSLADARFRRQEISPLEAVQRKIQTDRLLHGYQVSRVICSNKSVCVRGPSLNLIVSSEDIRTLELALECAKALREAGL
jgi:hypothetical protein